MEYNKIYNQMIQIILIQKLIILENNLSKLDSIN